MNAFYDSFKLLLLKGQAVYLVLGRVRQPIERLLQSTDLVAPVSLNPTRKISVREIAREVHGFADWASDPHHDKNYNCRSKKRGDESDGKNIPNKLGYV